MKTTVASGCHGSVDLLAQILRYMITQRNVLFGKVCFRVCRIFCDCMRLHSIWQYLASNIMFLNEALISTQKMY